MTGTTATRRSASGVDLATADQLGDQFSRFIRIVAKAKTRMAGLIPAGVEHGAFPIIAVLMREGPSRASALAECLHADISTISRQTSALVQAGLIERQADPADGRACLLAPTADGRAVFEQARESRNRWLADTLDDWPAEDVAQLLGLLERLNDDMAASITTAPTAGTRHENEGSA